MTDFDNPSSRHDESVRAGHEVTDVSMRGLVWFGVFLLILAVVIHIGLAVYIGLLEDRQEAVAPKPSPLADLREPVPGPPLEENPGQELQQVQAAQAELLSSYGWVNRPENVVHIPVSVAMELLADKLPVHEGGETESPPSLERSSPPRQETRQGDSPKAGDVPPGENPDRNTIPQNKTGAESGAGAPIGPGNETGVRGPQPGADAAPPAGDE